MQSQTLGIVCLTKKMWIPELFTVTRGNIWAILEDAIPWSDNKWCSFYFFDSYTDRYTITRLGTKSKDDVVFMSASSRVRLYFTMDMSIKMHQRQDSITPEHEIMVLIRIQNVAIGLCPSKSAPYSHSQLCKSSSDCVSLEQASCLKAWLICLSQLLGLSELQITRIVSNYT